MKHLNTNKIIKISSVVGEKEEWFDLQNKIVPQKIKTYFTDLDNMIGGWTNGDLIVIGGRPAMGKTSLTISMVNKMTKNGISVALFTIENVKKIISVLLSIICNIPIENILRWELTDKDLNLINSCLDNDISNRPLFINENSNMDIESLCEQIKNVVRKEFVKIVFIDYLQMVSVSGKNFDTRYEEINYITRNLKLLARELDIPIVLLSQLNRNLEEREGINKRPILTDFRDSGTICDDVDLACFLFRPEYYRITEDEKGNSLLGVAELIIAKQRFGQPNKVLLNFNSLCSKFDNYSYKD